MAEEHMTSISQWNQSKQSVGQLWLMDQTVDLGSFNSSRDWTIFSNVKLVLKM